MKKLFVWVRCRLWDTALKPEFNLRWRLLMGERTIPLRRNQVESECLSDEPGVCKYLHEPNPTYMIFWLLDSSSHLFYLNAKWPIESHISLQCLQYLIERVEFLWCVDGSNYKTSIFQFADFWIKMPSQPGFFTWRMRLIRFASKLLSTEQQPCVLLISFTGPM